MMQSIYDSKANLIGVLDIKPDGNIIVYDKGQSYAGDYYAKSNVTYDNHGRLVGYGNLTMLLLGRK